MPFQRPVLSTLACVATLICLAGTAFAQQAAPPPGPPVEMREGRVTPPAPPAAAATDVASLDAIVAALYDVISGPAGAPRNWDRFRSLFAPGARLLPIVKPRPDGPSEVRVMSPEDYVGRASKTFEQSVFYEREVKREVQTFGGLTHVWSTYEARHASDEARPFMRGINSIQVLNDGTRWWIVTVMWQPETPAFPLPK
jgi:hypothetical protein